MNPRFPVLSTIALILTWIGWIVLGLGAIDVFLVIIGLIAKSERATDAAAIISIALLASGMVLVTLGESIRVVFAIEQNTRAASEALSEIRSAMRADLERDKGKPVAS